MILARNPGLLVLLMAALSPAQNSGSRDAPANIRVHSDLVLINALVTDRHGSVITGLDGSQFRLFEDGKEQPITYCVSEDAPVSIGLVLDTSGSISAKLGLLKKAAIQFILAANREDEYFLLEFRGRPEVVVPFTSDTDRLTRSIDRMEAGGNTALYDAVHMAVREVQHANNPRKALLLVSDGIDNRSRHTERATKRLVSEVDFPIYTINVYEPPSGNRYAIQRRDTGVLELISAPTGGRAFAVRDPKKLTSVAELINSEIRHEYVLGYVPSIRVSDGRFHRVHVKVDLSSGAQYRVSNRAGYHAPDR